MDLNGVWQRFMEESQRLVAEQQEANLSRREGLLNAAAEEKEQVFADLSGQSCR